jgi:hypothetical protein
MCHVMDVDLEILTHRFICSGARTLHGFRVRKQNCVDLSVF